LKIAADVLSSLLPRHAPQTPHELPSCSHALANFCLVRTALSDPSVLDRVLLAKTSLDIPPQQSASKSLIDVLPYALLA